MIHKTMIECPWKRSKNLNKMDVKEECQERNKLNLYDKTRIFLFNPIKCQCYPHIEASQLICTANQLTSFYMRATMALN